MNRQPRNSTAPKRLTYNAPGEQTETMATTQRTVNPTTEALLPGNVCTPHQGPSTERRPRDTDRRSMKSRQTVASSVLSLAGMKRNKEIEMKQVLIEFDLDVEQKTRELQDELDLLNEEARKLEAEFEALGPSKKNLTDEQADRVHIIDARQKELAGDIAFKEKTLDKCIKRAEADRMKLTTTWELEMEKLKVIEEEGILEGNNSDDSALSEIKKERAKKWVHQQDVTRPTSPTKSYQGTVDYDSPDSDLQDDLRYDPINILTAQPVPRRNPATTDKDDVLINMMQMQMKLMYKTGGSAVEKKLPEFNGNPGDWSGFLETFQRTSSKFYMSDGENLARLREALKGEAREVVSHLLTKPSHVNKILLVLRERYGQPSLVIKWCLAKIKKCGKLDLNKPETLDKFGRSVEDWVLNVKSHKQTDHLRNTILLEELVRKLPSIWVEQWYEHCIVKKPKELNLEDFSLWLEMKVGGIRMRMQAEWAETKEFPTTEEKKQRGKRGPAHAAPTAEHTQQESTGCLFCSRKNHELHDCRDFKRLSLQQRLDFTRNSNLCYCCMQAKHHVKDCPEKRICGVDGCTKKHHPLVHNDLPERRRQDRPRRQQEPQQQQRQNVQNGGDEQNQEPEVGGATYVKGTNGPLGVVEVRLRGTNGKTVKTFALLDSGATSSYIEGSLADELGLQGDERMTTVSGIFGKKTSSSMKHVQLEIGGTYRGARSCKMRNVRTSQDLGLPEYSLDIDELKRQWPYLRRARVNNITKAHIRMIVGEDHGFLTMHRQCLFRDELSPVAKRTVLGWYISGNFGQDVDEAGIFAAYGLDEQMHHMIKDHFNVENFGVKVHSSKSVAASIEDKKAEATLNSTYSKTENGCEVGLLWRNSDVRLPESRPLALKRLQGMERKMDRDPEFATLYNAKFDEYRKKGYIRPVLNEREQSEREWYIPHFGVTNPNKPGKLRLVFDAAAKSNGCCLNDHLLKGPDLNRPLTEVLWNFRRHKYVISGDVEDMFHRVGIREEDRASQRFLWRDGDMSLDPITYEMNVMIFGATSSPTSAIYVKNRNAEEFREKYPEAYRAITEDFYVDDCLTGADTEEEAMQLYEDIVWVNKQANFNVKKWTSNSCNILSQIPEDMRSPAARDFNEKTEIPTERVLGLWWIPEEDVFTFRPTFIRSNQRFLLDAVLRSGKCAALS